MGSGYGPDPWWRGRAVRAIRVRAVARWPAWDWMEDDKQRPPCRGVSRGDVTERGRAVWRAGEPVAGPWCPSGTGPRESLAIV